MRHGSAMREFLADGAMVVASPGGAIARAAAGLGMAALLSFAPQPARSGELLPDATRSSIPLEQVAAVLPGTAPTLTHGLANEILNSHVAEVVENSVVHEYGDYRVPHAVAKQIVRAAEDTGFPADYLMAIAEKESSFRSDAGARTSSAKGFMGFTEQTWLSAVKRFGSDYGMEDFAKDIRTKTARNGAPVYFVDDAAREEEILAMREDAYVSSVMAAMDLKEARRRIEEKLEATLSDDDLYLPHFMGEDAARKVIAVAIDSPEASAAKMFPKAARANRAMFSNSNGRSLTVSEFRERLQSVIVTRVGKYGSVTEDVERASLVKDADSLRAATRDRERERMENASRAWGAPYAAL